MEDIKPFTNKPSASDHALEIVKATFAWDKEQAVIATDGKGLASKEKKKKNGDEKEKKGEVKGGADQGEGEESAMPLVEGDEPKAEDQEQNEEIVNTLFDINLEVGKVCIKKWSYLYLFFLSICTSLARRD